MLPKKPKTWVLGSVQLDTMSYLIILQMNFALTMTSDRLMGSVDPSSQASESVASLSVVCRQEGKGCPGDLGESHLDQPEDLKMSVSCDGRTSLAVTYGHRTLAEVRAFTSS